MNRSLRAAAAAILWVLAPGPVSAEPRIATACSTREAAELREALVDVGRIAQSCLVDQRLNFGLAGRLRGALDRGEVTFQCRDAGGGVLGSTSVRDAGADVSVVTWPPRELADFFPGEHVFTVFHELIHAVDPGEERLLSSALHNLGFFPDGVYGCHLACLGSIPTEKARQRVLVYEAVAEADIPEKQGWPCRGAVDECRLVRKFAWLCENNGPFVNERVYQRIGLLEETYCVAAGARSECAAPECAAALENLTVGGRTQTPAAVAFVSRIFRIVRALEERDTRLLSGEDSRLAVSLRPVVDRCRKDSAAYQ